ncbi:efflux RND transporter permease subunit, partial [Alphaproteobacteria bacterium]|nr:efflux RND transporter permease subunit [Alphaproteobacteria bacterium]
MLVQRGKTSDSLKTNAIVQNYITEKRATLSDGLMLDQFDVRADLISQRIMLMVQNGLGGLVLVMLVLFAFLPFRVAFWVATGIPVAFLATFGVMFATGQSINMISLFGLIMALGIVVDDAIVIGEHAEYLRKKRNIPI